MTVHNEAPYSAHVIVLVRKSVTEAEQADYRRTMNEATILPAFIQILCYPAQ